MSSKLKKTQVRDTSTVSNELCLIYGDLGVQSPFSDSAQPRPGFTPGELSSMVTEMLTPSTH